MAKTGVAAMTPERPLLTIVIPTYQALDLIPQCIDSIRAALGCSLGSTVLVTVQDGRSQDGIVDYVRNLAIPGITIASEQDSGIYDAMNKAVQQASTPWIYFLGADDQLLPDFVKVLPLLDDLSAIYYGSVVFTSDRRKYDGRFSPLKLVFRNICHQAIFYPTRLLAAHPYQTKYSIKADWATNIILMSSYAFRYVDYSVALYNNENGMSRMHEDVIFNSDRNRLFRHAFGFTYYLLSATAPLITRIYHRLSRHQR